MATLNVTVNGVSADLPVRVEFETPVNDLKRIAWEVIRSGGAAGLHFPTLAQGTFEHYVVDRFREGEGGQRLYLRPKVPFGVAG
jgi:hypothetical protein